ncbi:MAG: phosphatase PAP2 family protein [Verrucomicrobiota bacterium]|nr:phosphatase PAP2 family protein [Verrucomicrobiota bacterium]
MEKKDIELGEKIASNRDHPLVKAAGTAGKIGDQGPLYVLSAGLSAIGLAARNRRLAGSGLSMLTALAAADLGKRLTKRLVRRTRPHVLLDHGRYEKDTGGSDRKPEQSFPSGHTAGSVAVARALSRNFPRAGAATGVAALGIGLSRIAKGAHWPLDVAAGAILGLAAEALSAGLLTLVLRYVPCRWRRTDGSRKPSQQS